MKFSTVKTTLKTLWQNRIFSHTVYWLCAVIFLFLNVVFWETPLFALKLVTILVLPGPFPVYLHFFLLKRFFQQRKYLPYAVSLVSLVLLSGLLFELVFKIIEKDPGSHTSGIGTAIFYIIFTTGIRYYRSGLVQQYRLPEAEFKQLQTELALLKSQINPHFFFNTLNNLYSLSLDKSDRVPGVILELSDLMRYVLDSSKETTVDLENEYNFLKSYLALEKLRLSTDVDIQLTSSSNLSGKHITPMLLIPFLENSFKHGLNASAGSGYLHIDMSVNSENIFHFTIENSKPEKSNTAKNSSPQMGLKNVKRRLELLYPHKHILSIKDNEHDYKIKLDLQL